jgi:hypothetical protein
MDQPQRRRAERPACRWNRAAGSREPPWRRIHAFLHRPVVTSWNLLALYAAGIVWVYMLLLWIAANIAVWAALHG